MAIWPDPDATTVSKGAIQLAGDLGGTATSPAVRRASRTVAGTTLQRAFNPRDYGATGDGTTDDTSALNSWISAASTANAPLYLPAGIYKTTSTLNITWWAGFQLVGDGQSASVIYTVGAAVNGIVMTPPSGVYRAPLIRDIGFRGNTAGATTPGITGDGFTWATAAGAVVSMPRMSGVEVIGFGGHGIRIQPTFDWLRFEDIHTIYNGGHGIYFNTVTRLGSIATIVGGGSTGNSLAGIKGTGNLTLLNVIGHELSYNNYGIQFDNTEGTSTGYLHLVGCRSEGIVTRHVDIKGSLYGVTIEHYDALSTPTNGGALISVDTCKDVLIKGVLGRGMVDQTAVVVEVNNPHVTYIDMQNSVNSVVSGTGYMRQDTGGFLHPIAPGIHMWGISQETSVASSDLAFSTVTSGVTWVVDCSAANRAASLPDATVMKGRVFVLIKKSSANTLTVQATLSQLINGVASIAITGNGDSVVVTSDGVGWYTAAGRVAPVDATTTVKGLVRLAGDLGGTALSPTVPALANKADLTSGKVPTSELGSGAASSTTFLRGDQAWATPAGGGATVDVQVFTSNGTWTKPAGCSAVTVQLLGGGGAGGSGRMGAAGTVRCGGGGGGGGAREQFTLPASALGATETVGVGAGGTGGTAIATNDTNGNGGGAGGSSTFGVRGSNFVAQTRTSNGGSGGTASSGTLGVASSSGLSGGGNGGGASSVGGAGGAGADSLAAASGGGAGGGVSAADAPTAGGGGGRHLVVVSLGVLGGAINTAGGAGVSSDANSARPGGGGAGGGASITTNGGAGGSGGIYGGGGAGGGGALNGNNSGAGGDGGSGIVVVISQ